VSSRLEQLVGGIEGGQWHVDLLLKDRQLYENMNQAASELRTLMAEIRRIRRSSQRSRQHLLSRKRGHDGKGKLGATMSLTFAAGAIAGAGRWRCSYAPDFR